MVLEQGDIIWVDFNPTKGHEQSGRRPALVVSTKVFNKHTGLLFVLPITNTNNHFPLHVSLDDRTKTTGVILCEHIRSIDPASRSVKLIEKLPEDIFSNVKGLIKAMFDL